MNTRTLVILILGFLAAAASAAPAPSLNYTPVSCVKAGELPLMQLSIEGEGDLRGFFRRTNSTDWCSVDGVNDGPLSRVVLPKFNDGDEIEYFFVLSEGRRVLARSPRIYRVRVSTSCEVPSARHNLPVSLSCGDDVQATPAAMGAAYALTSNEPTNPSPDSPAGQ